MISPLVMRRNYILIVTDCEILNCETLNNIDVLIHAEILIHTEFRFETKY